MNSQLSMLLQVPFLLIALISNGLGRKTWCHPDVGGMCLMPHNCEEGSELPANFYCAGIGGDEMMCCSRIKQVGITVPTEASTAGPERTDIPTVRPNDVTTTKECCSCASTVAIDITTVIPDRSKLSHLKDCAAIKVENPNSTDGVYNITLGRSNRTVEVWCDMTTNRGGWTVFQKRGNFSFQENFFRGINDYKRGFGNVKMSYWLGLEAISEISNYDEPQLLRVDLEDLEGVWKYAEYSTFEVAGESDKYKLIVGDYDGNAGDSLYLHNKQHFSAKDYYSQNGCAKSHKGGWWYVSPVVNCGLSNLNGIYLRGVFKSGGDGVTWERWFRPNLKTGSRYSFRVSEMKLRPRNF